MNKRIYHILLFLFPISLLAQEEIPLKIVPVDDREVPFSFRKFEKPILEEELEFTASELISEMLASGYATASADQVEIKRDTAWIHLYVGEKYRIASLDIPDSSRYIFEEIGLKNNWNKKAFLTKELLSGIQESILDRLENNGYPYGKVTFDNARLDSSSVSLSVDIDKGPLIRFDTIHNVKQAAITRGYISTYTGIKEGKIYDQSLANEMDGRMNELPFLRVLQPSRIWFSNDDKAHVEVFLEERNVSKFDFLIGVLPNNSSTGKVLVTGDVGISLWNIFGTGKKIDIGWKRLKPKSQQLNVYFDYPYILGTPIGADIDFVLDKQDTTYLDLDWTLGVQYLFRGIDKVKIVVHNLQTFVQNPDTTYIRQTGKLPPTLDQSTLLTGLEAYFERLNYLYNPNSGWELGATVTAGFKKIRENNTILDFSLPEGGPTTQMLYDSLGTRSAKFSVSWLANYYVPLGQRQVLLLGTNGAAVYNRDLLINELYRIGGTEGLRGFDEESIYTSLYNIVTIEYRYLLDKNAYLAVFFDWAYTEERLQESYSNDYPFGFGAGLNFETKAGIFGVSYAVGRQNGNPLDFRSSKIHFGYVNIF